MSTVTESFVAQQASRQGGFELPCSVDMAFPLFSPERERLWIKEWEWDPQPLFPDKIEFRRDTLFRTGHGVEEATWIIVEVDPKQHRAEYIRVASASHAAHIVVKVEPHGTDRCRVSVNYTLTAIAQPGDSLVQFFSEDAFAARMRSWKRQIDEYLATTV